MIPGNGFKNNNFFWFFVNLDLGQIYIGVVDFEIFENFS